MSIIISVHARQIFDSRGNPTVEVDVRQFGAVGDGVTDDTEAFLRAIAAVSDGAVFQY